MNTERPVMTVEEAAEYLRVSACTVYRLLRLRLLVHSRTGRRYQITRTACDAYLASAQVAATPTAPAPKMTVTYFGR